MVSIFRSGAAPNNDSLVGYWKLEEALASANKTDSSGDGHTGSPSGTLLPQPSMNAAPTNFGNSRSLTFGTDNNAINISAAAGINDLPEFTAAAWVYPTSYAGESLQGRILDKTTSVDGWSFGVDNGALHFYANFSSSPLSKVTTALLDLNEWAHVAVYWDGTSSASGVRLFINGEEQVSFASAVDGVGSRVSDATFNMIIGNGSALNRSFAGDIDEVRLYNRQLLDTELADLANGDQATATWTGAISSDYETAGNWDTGATPDPYAHVKIEPAANQPIASTEVWMGGLTIEAGARFNLLNYNLGLHDGGQFSNEGTLQMRNTQTLSNFTNDSDSGTVMLATVSDTTGLKAGDTYHNLIFNDSTFAHWPLDETSSGQVKDVSGYERHGVHEGGASPSASKPATNFANETSLEFDGVDDAVSFDDLTMPQNATWCAWVNAVSDGVVLGSGTPGYFALAIDDDGTTIRVAREVGVDDASWTVADVRGSWHSICVVQTAVIMADLILYIDGVSQGGSEGLTVPIGTVSAIGTDGTDYFEGLIDDVRIYSRVLNGAEVVRIAEGNQPAITSVNRLTLSAPVDINGDLVLNGGIFDVSTSNHAINLGGNFINHSGVFQRRSGTVNLDGQDQFVHSSTAFYNLTKQTATADTLTFGRGTVTTIHNQLTLNGAEDELLSLRSSVPGVQWFIDPLGSETVDYLDIQDSNNINPAPIDITNATVTDSGNNYNWTVNVAPDDPSNLGSLEFTGGNFVADSTPTLNFELNDANPIDQLRYHVQISSTSDFSSLAVDYLSPLGAQGSRSFTVGQASGGGTYTVGSEGMELATADYYWRVRTIDNYVVPNESGFVSANGGSIAFKLDVTPPSNPGVPTTESPMTSKTPTWEWEESEDNESGLGTPIYTLQWSTDSEFLEDINSQTTSNTSFTHGTPLDDGRWYFRVQAKDVMNNLSEWAESEMHMIDTTGPNTPIAPNTSSPTNFNQPTWAWPIPLDAGIGLAETDQYTVQWSQVSNFSSVFGSTVTSNNLYAHAVALDEGTWYFRVRAVDKLGNQSAWSSHGTVLIDTKPPSLPGRPYAGDDPFDEDPISDNTPTWKWDASTDAGVGLTAMPYFVQWSTDQSFSSVAGSTTVGSNTFTHGGELADGVWYIRVNAKDTLNNQSAYSLVGEVEIDTTPPDVPEAPTTTSPTNNTLPTWSWPEPDETGVGLRPVPYDVEWSQDEEFNTIVGSAAVSETSFTHSTELTEGTWYFRVRASDLVDNTSDFSEPGSVWIDLTPPSDPGQPTTSDPINEGFPTWNWDASTDDGGTGLDTPAYEVWWSLDPNFIEDVSTGYATTNTFQHVDELLDGTWHIQVRAIDKVGNASEWSEPGYKVVDVLPPTPPGLPTTTSPTANNTPTWEWEESEDAGLGLATTPYMLEWSQDEDFLLGVETETVEDPEFTHQDALADGTWYFRLRAIDAVGNISEYSELGEVIVDATAPSIAGLPTTTTPTTNETPTWSWPASTDEGGVGIPDEGGYIVEWSPVFTFLSGVESASADSNEFTHSTPLTDGIWYFRVRAVDKVGNESGNSPVGSVEVDDTPPSTPGDPTTTTPTSDNQPTWSWTASTDNGVDLRNPGYDVEWSQDDSFESGVVPSQVNTNEFTHSTPLTDGTWYFRVRAVDNLNNTSPWSELGEVLVSTAGPTTPGLPTTQHPTTNTQPTWEWEASESLAELATPAYTVEWSQDENFLLGVQSDPINDAEFTHSTPLTDGVWYFRVIAEDKTGMFSEYSEPGMVRVDTTPPTIPGEPETASPTNSRTPTWEWEASSDSGVDLADTPYEIEWSDDNFGDNIISATSDTNTFTHTDELADGTWHFRVRAKDKLDNISAYSEIGSVEIDATAPLTPSTPTTETPTNDRTPTWEWEDSSDGDGTGLGTPAYEIEWSQDGAFESGIISSTSMVSSFTHEDDLTDGEWYIRVRAVDEVGNKSIWSERGEVEVDRSTPLIPGTPTVGSQSTNNPAPKWTWESSDDSGVGLGTPAYDVEWSQDPDFLTGVSNAPASDAEFTHSSALAEGYWYIRVRAVDKVNNWSGYSGVGMVYIDTDLPSPPGTPTPMTSPTSDNTPSWTWPESTDIGFGFGDEPYELQWSQDSLFVDGVIDGIATTESFTHTTPLSDGTWHFRVRAVDDAGNLSSWSSHGSIFIDASPPSLPGNLSTTSPTKNPLPVWTWDASTDEGIGIVHPTYEVEWSSTSDFSSGVTQVTTDEPTYEHTTELGFGVWHFRVRATDLLDNKTAWIESSVYIDSDPPVLSQITATPGSQGVLITWNTDEIASSRVTYGFGSSFSETTPETNTSPRVTEHSVAITGLASCSTYQFKITSIDQLENEAESAPYSFTTTACSGDAAVTGQSQQTINTSGGQVSLNGGTAALDLQVPSNSVEESADFQIKQLSPAPALSGIGQPDNRHLIGSHIYDIKALKGGNVQVKNFGGLLTVSISYTLSEAAGYDQNGFAIYRHDGTSWHQLSDCQVNSSVRVVSCQTSSFSVFGLFGQRLQAAPPAPAIPEGDGTIEPDPVPEIAPGRPEPSQQEAVESATERRGLSAAVTRIVKTVVSRPAWWISLLLVAASVTTLVVLKRRRGNQGHVPYGIHKKDD